MFFTTDLDRVCANDMGEFGENRAKRHRIGPMDRVVLPAGRDNSQQNERFDDGADENHWLRGMSQ